MRLGTQFDTITRLMVRLNQFGIVALKNLFLAIIRLANEERLGVC